MKLLVVVDGRLSKPAGAEKQAILLATSLAKRGHEVVLLGPRFDPGEPIDELLDGVCVHKIAYPRIRIVGALILIAKFIHLLSGRFGSFDAVHVHMAKNLAAVAGILRPSMRWTLTVKISGAWEFDGGILDPALRKQFLTRLRNHFIRKADAIQCISVYTRDRLIEAGYSAARIHMIPNGVRLPEVNSPISLQQPDYSPRNECVVSFVGRQVHVKGLDVLLRAWAMLPREYGAKLLLIGDGPERGALEASARELGIDGSVTFVGYSNDVDAYLSKSDVYVQPSRQEGMPNAVLQAMACGLPIVATAVSGNVDLVIPEQNGILVPSEDSHALCEALDNMIRDAGMRARMGRASRASAASYDLQRVLDRLETVYKSSVYG